MKNHLKKNSGILLSILISTIFVSFIIIKMHNYSLRTNIFIMIISLIFSIIVHKYFNKYNYQINKKQRNIGIFTSTIITILIIFCLKNILIYNYKETSIIINKNYQSIENLDIENFIINNVKYSKMEGNYFNTFNYSPNTKVKYIFNHENTEIKFEKLRNIKITFNCNENITVKENDKEIKITDENQIYEINSNKYFSIVSFIISFCIIGFYTYSLYKLFINKNNNKDSKIFIILCLSIISIGLYYFYTLQSNILFNDSLSYLDYDFKSFLHLKFSGRTPIYSLIIYILRVIFQTDYMKYICITQYIIWFISLLYLYKTLVLLTKQEKFSALAVTLYSLSPAIISWNNVILTESFALSGTLIFIYYIIKYIKEQKTKDGIIASIIALILTFHRPTSIIYVVFLNILFIFRIIFEKKERKKDLKCFSISILSIVLIIIYAIIFNNTYGIYSISDAMPRQDLYVSMKEGFYKYSNDSLFIERVETALNHSDNMWNNMLEVKEYYSLKEIKELTNYARKNSINKYIEYIIDLIKSYSEVKFEDYSFNTINDNFAWINVQMRNSYSIITFGHVYLMILICFVLMLISWIKNKKAPYLYAGLFAFPLVIIISSFIGTCNEFMRTAICAVPFTYISIILMISMTCNKLKE